MTKTSDFFFFARSSLPDGSAVFEKSRLRRYSESLRRTAGFARSAMGRDYALLRLARLTVFAALVFDADLRSREAAAVGPERTEPFFLPPSRLSRRRVMRSITCVSRAAPGSAFRFTFFPFIL